MGDTEEAEIEGSGSDEDIIYLDQYHQGSGKRINTGIITSS